MPPRDLLIPPLHIHPAWRLQRVDGQLFLSGGLDATYLLDELTGEAIDRFEASWNTGSIAGPAARSTTGAEENANTALLDKLLTLGALYRPTAEPTAHLQVALRWAGAPSLPFSEALARAADTPRHNAAGAPTSHAWSLDTSAETDASASADITLVVRTNASLVETSDRAAQLAGPHLLVDLSHHETVVLGPFVVKGQTACLGCLAGRMNHLWGDPPPAPEPAMGSRAVLVASLVAEHLQTFANRRSMPALVQHAWSLSLTTWETHLHPVFLLPWCPVCQQGTPADGRIAF
ncbi:MAG: hypothetical protein RLZZ618_154 [Pseudomonadota bacterium]|jgi:bacteriocin biosynthesis cyclodehydratase domain-containing protein